MDRCALFVDAGYALADGAMAVHGTRRRDSVSWDHSGLLKMLAGLARDRTGLPVLRCYWYETADGGRTAEHDSLAEMPGLKLRLVNTRPGRREGIESQLRRDIVTLAKSGAIADAFIASADEHLAEIVAEVQDLGLRVVVLHIASDGGWTIPQPLRQECDDIVEISAVHLRPFVDLIRGAEPAPPEEHYTGAGYGSRSRADGDGSTAAATAHSGLPAQALPAPVGGYQRSGGADYGSAQPYANSGSTAYDPGTASSRSSAPEQALMAVRGAEPDSGSGQLTGAQFGGRQQEGTAGQVNGTGQAAGPHAGGQPYGPYGSGAEPHAGPGQRAAPDPGTAQHASPAQAQQASFGQGQHGVDSGTPQYGQHSGGGQRAGQSGAPQHAAHGRPAQHPAHAALEALEHSAHAGNLQSGNAPSPGTGKPGGAAGIAPQGGGLGAGAVGSGRGEGSSPTTGYPDSASTGVHAQSGDYPGGGYQGGGYQSGSPANAYQDGGPHDGYHGTPGAPGPAQNSTVHSLSGLSFPAGTAGSVQNGHPGDPSANSTAASGYQGSYQNGSGVYAAPGYQNGSAQNPPGQYGSFGGYQPGGSNNGGQVNHGLVSGGSGNPAGNGAPANGSGAGGGRSNLNPADFEAAPVAGQPSPYGSMDPGYFAGQAGPGPQAQQQGSQPVPGTHARDAYGPARDAYGPAQASGPSFQPRAAHQASHYQAQPQLPSQVSQPAAPLPVVRAAQPVAVSLPEAVKAAHSEGYTFGESVGRDAPGLWLEAVLARKPRMPSDLEARLLQGSVLPIDSLLHDEVRHSLRRGFWDALESARR